MDVGAADAARLGADEHVARADLGSGTSVRMVIFLTASRTAAFMRREA